MYSYSQIIHVVSVKLLKSVTSIVIVQPAQSCFNWEFGICKLKVVFIFAARICLLSGQFNNFFILLSALLFFQYHIIAEKKSVFAAQIGDIFFSIFAKSSLS